MTQNNEKIIGRIPFFYVMLSFLLSIGCLLLVR